MKLTKNGQPKQSGGKRPNSGAKPKGDAPNYNTFSFRPTANGCGKRGTEQASEQI